MDDEQRIKALEAWATDVETALRNIYGLSEGEPLPSIIPATEKLDAETTVLREAVLMINSFAAEHFRKMQIHIAMLETRIAKLEMKNMEEEKKGDNIIRKDFGKPS